MGALGDNLGSGVDFVQSDVGGRGDIDDNASRAGNLGLQQGAGDGGHGGLLGLVLAAGVAHAHVGVAGVLHNRLYILEVQVDNAGQLNQVGDGLHALAQHVIGHDKGVGQSDALLADQLQALVGDDHQGVHLLPQGGNAFFSLLHAALALKGEGLGDDAHGEGALLPGNLGHPGGSAGAGAAAHAGGDEHHVGVLQDVGNGLAAFLRGLLADFGLRAGAAALGNLLADLNLHRSLGPLQGLLIGVHANQLHAAHAGAGNAVYGVAAAAAHADHFYRLRSFIQQVVNFKRHVRFLLGFSTNGIYRSVKPMALHFF